MISLRNRPSIQNRLNKVWQSSVVFSWWIINREMVKILNWEAIFLTALSVEVSGEENQAWIRKEKSWAYFCMKPCTKAVCPGYTNRTLTFTHLPVGYVEFESIAEPAHKIWTSVHRGEHHFGGRRQENSNESPDKIWTVDGSQVEVSLYVRKEDNVLKPMKGLHNYFNQRHNRREEPIKIK